MNMPKNRLIASRDRFSLDHPEIPITVNSRIWGAIRVGDTGPALVLIPGTLGRADIFFQQILALKSRVRILALSYPASGGIEDWHNDVRDLIVRFQLEGAVVLGSSLGGYLVQYMAGENPDMLGGIIAANTLPSVLGIDQMSPYSADLDATPIAVLRDGFGDGISKWITPDNPYASLAELLLAEVKGRIPESELRTRLKALKFGPELPNVSLRNDQVFTIESGDDHLIPPNWQDAVRARLQPVRAYRFETGSHFPYVTRPEGYTALLEEVLGLSDKTAQGPKGVEIIL